MYLLSGFRGILTNIHYILIVALVKGPRGGDRGGDRGRYRGFAMEERLKIRVILDQNTNKIKNKIYKQILEPTCHDFWILT